MKTFTAGFTLLMLILGSLNRVNAASQRAVAAPDWSGWWILQNFARDAKQLNAENPLDPFAPPPLKSDLLPQFKKMMDAFLAGEDTNAIGKTGPAFYCQPFRFNGVGLLVPDPEAALELLLTPGRVTITDESGRLRRIHTAGQLSSVQIEETNTGTSVGRWEGETLIVETRGLSHEATVGFTAGVSLGSGAYSIERIFLKRKDVLQVDSTVVAPDSLAAPYKVTRLYQRDSSHVPHEFSYCNDYDRQIDPVTGNQRFDLTPPTDLPPPPQAAP